MLFLSSAIDVDVGSVTSMLRCESETEVCDGALRFSFWICCAILFVLSDGSSTAEEDSSWLLGEGEMFESALTSSGSAKSNSLDVSTFSVVGASGRRVGEGEMCVLSMGSSNSFELDDIGLLTCLLLQIFYTGVSDCNKRCVDQTMFPQRIREDMSDQYLSHTYIHIGVVLGLKKD